MSKKILIDSSFENETRIALIDNDKLEEYEIESTNNTRIKSNVYLGKISRVEASLQAAFVDFGGNRHGFLPFTEIHPDYFKLPVADQKKLKDLIEKSNEDSIEENNISKQDIDNLQTNEEESESILKENNTSLKNKSTNKNRLFFNFFKKYKIQEVIKPRQVILVQISKEERGLKGAALSTYLSFAGRYCVLMPNNNNKVGISRKIQDQLERKKLKDILDSLGIPKGMSTIVRTAGIGKSKKEIGKDLDFLMSQWNKIRDLTLKSNAPALIYEEGNLIKRTIRDLFNKDIKSIIVDGKDGYSLSKEYIKTLVPKQISKLKLHKDKKENLFAKHSIEKQIEELYNTNTKLPSGGSIVINPTEALVAIDVNSGKATQQRHIENTALNTNLEAAVEISRQLKLRDLAGLIVIDFIDMEDYRNNFKVEKAIRTATNSDRARIQIGRISPFGLMELSRQRLRTSILEKTFEKCNLCGGSGTIRNSGSVIEQLFKVLLQYCISNKNSKINIKCNSRLADDILNKRKEKIMNLEKSYNCNLFFEFHDSFTLNEPQIKVVDKNLKEIENIEKQKLISKKSQKNEKVKKKIKRIVKVKKKAKIKDQEDDLKEDIKKNITQDEIKNDKTKKGWWIQGG